MRNKEKITKDFDEISFKAVMDDKDHIARGLFLEVLIDIRDALLNLSVEAFVRKT